MDIDVMGKHIHGLLAFKDKIEQMIEGAGDAKSAAHGQVDELLAFKAEVQGVLPMLEKTALDVSGVIADLGTIKEQLAPALAWISEQQKAYDAAKIALDEPAKPDETVADKPLEHLAEVETALDSKLTLDQVNATTKPPVV